MEKEIFSLLSKLNINYTNHSHSKVFTVDEAKLIDDNLETTPTKNLFLKDKKKRYFLITLHAYKSINLKEVSKQIGAKGTVSFAKEEDLNRILNISHGSVNPFCMIYSKKSNEEVSFFIDSEIYNDSTIGVHPMRNDMTTIISPKDLEVLFNYKQIGCNLIYL